MLTETISPLNSINAALKLATCSDDGQQKWWVIAAGWASIGWYLIVMGVCIVGCIQIKRNYSAIPRKSISANTLPPSLVPHVTVIRPIKGLEPYLYENLAASLRQEYPKDKLDVHFCISSRQDPAFPILERLLANFPNANARIFFEPEYADHELGPNPKIRNMSRAYFEAKSDIIWIVDCNVWLGKGVCGRMVDRLCGLGSKGRKYKFVHHLPIVVDVDDEWSSMKDEEEAISSFPSINYAADMDAVAQQLNQQPATVNGDNIDARDGGSGTKAVTTTKTAAKSKSAAEATAACMFSKGGGRLEELFLSSAHAKMYCAINTVLIAPCVVGKSTMFRRSHLNYLTPASKSSSRPYSRRPGIDYFSDNICEDHLIGDRLWKGKIFEETEYGQKWGKHDLVFGDLAIQPMNRMSIPSYIDRRVRWLRVRKFTVLLATLVEPGTECFLCSAYIAFGITTIVPYHLLYQEYCSHFLSSWTAFALIWMVSVLLWITVDWNLYRKIQSAATIEVDEHTPFFARPPPASSTRRPFIEWFMAWLGRESFALPIWLWSFYGGTTIMWRDRIFKVGMDSVAHEIGRKTTTRVSGPQTPGGPLYYESQRGHGYSNHNNGHEGTEIRRRTPTGSLVKGGISTKSSTSASDSDETSPLIL